MTRALQSSPFLRKDLQNLFIFKNQRIKERKMNKKCYTLSFPILGGCDLTGALQSSLFQISGGLVQAWRMTNKGQRISPCLILDKYFTKGSIALCQEFFYLQGNLRMSREEARGKIKQDHQRVMVDPMLLIV